MPSTRVRPIGDANETGDTKEHAMEAGVGPPSRKRLNDVFVVASWKASLVRATAAKRQPAAGRLKSRDALDKLQLTMAIPAGSREVDLRMVDEIRWMSLTLRFSEVAAGVC